MKKMRMYFPTELTFADGLRNKFLTVKRMRIVAYE